MTDQPRMRIGTLSRRTGETHIESRVRIDGTGQVQSDTGVPFLDHMLDAFGRHGRLDLTVTATGDSAMDPHHTVEDTGIVLGQNVKAALGERHGIDRYGFAYAPLDEALARAVIDISGRPYFEFNGDMPEPMIGADFAASLVEEFWRAFAMNAGWTMHIDILKARNSHHAAEAVFKAAAVAMRTAVNRSGPDNAVPSTKGMLG